MNDLDHQVAMTTHNLLWSVTIVAEQLRNQETRRRLQRELSDLRSARDDLSAIIRELEPKFAVSE